MKVNFIVRFKYPVVVIIGGVPGVGKSTLAVNLAKKLGITEIIGTDVVREVLRTIKNKRDNPFIFEVTHCAWKLIGPKNGRNIINGYKRHCQTVLPAVIKTINNFLKQGKDIIVEGAHIPLLDISKINQPVNIFKILLKIDNQKMFLDRLEKKHVERHQRRRKKWSEHFDEFLIIQEFNKKFCSADLIINNNNRNKTINKIINLIKERAK